MHTVLDHADLSPSQLQFAALSGAQPAASFLPGAVYFYLTDGPATIRFLLSDGGLMLETARFDT